MSFISDLDQEALDNPKRYLYIFKKVVINNDERINRNFLLRKGTSKKDKRTRILYVKGDARVRFTDNDVLYMIMQISDREVTENILSRLKDIYINGLEYTVSSKVGSLECYVNICEKIDYEQMFFNYKDITISYEDLVYLIILILIKDMDANETFVPERDYHKRTLCKYISTISYYYFKDEVISSFWKKAGIESTGDFWVDFETGINAMTNQTNSKKYALFEKCMNIC